MASFPKITVDTTQALAVALAVFNKRGQRVESYRENVGGNKEDIIDHFVNGSDLVLDLEAADAVKKTIAHRVTMSSISDVTIPDFLMSVFNLLEKDTVSIKSAGIIAWAPKLAQDIIKREEERHELFLVGANSKFIHGSKITITFNLLKTYYLQMYNSYSYVGHDGNGNLVTFFNKKKINDKAKIVGKIKTHRKEARFNDACITVLNYVKEIK